MTARVATKNYVPIREKRRKLTELAAFSHFSARCRVDR
jgi:hypothetical protein